MPYLFVATSGEIQEENNLHEDDILDVIEGDIQVFRFHEGHFQEFTPIDEKDTTNWSNV